MPEASYELAVIWSNYIATIDFLKIARRSFSTNPEENLNGTTLIHNTREEITQKFDTCRSDADNYIVLTLWVVFERSLFSLIQKEFLRFQPSDDTPITSVVREKSIAQIEYWRIDEVLDIFKDRPISSTTIGDIKNIKKYRDWIAHKNPSKPMPSNVRPEYAFRILTETLNLLETSYGTA